MPSQLLGTCPTQLLDSIPEGQSKGINLDQHNLFVIHHQGRYYAYLNQCPHLGIELEWMPDQFLDHARQFIHCATHGALFLIKTGKCISGPCQGQSLQPVTVEEDGDQIKFLLP
ncbi:ferredoxin [Hahella sp. CCB-MM4]|uniref:Rieske (2Fe-2S) protein n=1 Tax=Hahella sp. (strain CCB-MM4) TaxID=1926491 RepID=UPI000B9BFE00|nr:Rieske (2Fe-2S) protein [Hahella sp. CCB-MM4]OZG70047.1 ferredoxin [Hahella sp. CCB-MM4]